MANITKGPTSGQVSGKSAGIKVAKGPSGPAEGVTGEVYPPLPGSRLLFGFKGERVITLDDAKGRDLTGRKLITGMVLNEEETPMTDDTLDDFQDAVVARIIAGLPKRE